jgi:hypothetical protein
MLQRFNFALFSKGPPATNRESLGGEREGTRALFRLPLSGLFLRAPLRVAVSFLGPHQRKTFLSNPRGKGEIFTLGLSDARFLSGRLRFRPTYPAGRSELCAKARDR